jgi:hypothetical protein
MAKKSHDIGLCDFVPSVFLKIPNRGQQAGRPFMVQLAANSAQIFLPGFQNAMVVEKIRSLRTPKKRVPGFRRRLQATSFPYPESLIIMCDCSGHSITSQRKYDLLSSFGIIQFFPSDIKRNAAIHRIPHFNTERIIFKEP